jgi:ribosomal protein S18 acetylase RimI-like enzyme
MARIGFARPRDGDDVALVEGVTQLVNQAFLEAEAAIWRTGATRTNAAEVRLTAARGGLVLARDRSRPVAAAFYDTPEVTLGHFGALSVDPSCAGAGIARSVVDFLEHHARASGCTAMQLEILLPDPPLTHSLRLLDWYRRRGYHEVSRGDFADMEPTVAALLLRPSQVVVCVKDLARRPA